MFIVFDLDDTLRSTAGSEHLVPANVTRTENWLLWQDYVNRYGRRIEPVVALYYQCVTTPTLILTSSQCGTAEWLTSNGINQPTAIIERPRDEHRSSFDFKREWVDENVHQIALWVDDHVKMCDYVESLGIPVVRVSPRLTGDNNGIH